MNCTNCLAVAKLNRLVEAIKPRAYTLFNKIVETKIASPTNTKVKKNVKNREVKTEQKGPLIKERDLEHTQNKQRSTASNHVVQLYSFKGTT